MAFEVRFEAVIQCDHEIDKMRRDGTVHSYSCTDVLRVREGVELKFSRRPSRRPSRETFKITAMAYCIAKGWQLEPVAKCPYCAEGRPGDDE